jgi:hypothetical protein
MKSLQDRNSEVAANYNPGEPVDETPNNIDELLGNDDELLPVTRDNVASVCDGLLKEGKQLELKTIRNYFLTPTAAKLRVYVADWKEENASRLVTPKTSKQDLQNHIVTLEAKLADAERVITSKTAEINTLRLIIESKTPDIKSVTAF